MLAMCIGFFMILVDMTIVGRPAGHPAGVGCRLQLDHLGDEVYLLTYAVPLLVAGRLGDKFGPKLIFQIGLVIFTAASVWCILDVDRHADRRAGRPGHRSRSGSRRRRWRS